MNNAQVLAFLKPTHLMVILVIVVILFGASKLPELAKNLGKSAKIIKQEMREITEDDSAKNHLSEQTNNSLQKSNSAPTSQTSSVNSDPSLSSIQNQEDSSSGKK